MTVSLPHATPSASQSTAQGANAVEADKDDIWSTILKGVASSKMVHTKNVLVLGDPGCGKSTLIHYLKHDPGPQKPKIESDDTPTTTSFVLPSNNNYNPAPVDSLSSEETNTLALGYTFTEVQDEDSEAIARLGMYQLGLSAPEYLPLLHFALSADTLADSMILIVLDWSRPWTFLETLQRWVDVLQRAISEICKEGSAGESWSRGKAIVDELKEKVEYYMQTYTEPVNSVPMSASASASSPPQTPSNFAPVSLVTTTTAADQVTLPLTQGCLTKNLGIPVAVVCCKSDAISKLEQTQDYKDDQFDFIQQTLRCICMKYGAALFYTSTLHPYTFHNLRQYILHRVLTTSAKSYPFSLKAQVVERDTVLVPAGWDSWGKIRVLRDSFACDAVHLGWDADLEAITDRQPPSPHGARNFYEDAIPDPESESQPQSFPSPAVICEDEQVFLSRHLDTLQRVSHVSQLTRPLGTRTMSGDMTYSADSSAVLDKLGSVKGTGSGMTPDTNGETHMSSPNAAAMGAVGEPHEVLSKFFQSLLSKKAGVSGSDR